MFLRSLVSILAISVAPIAFSSAWAASPELKSAGVKTIPQKNKMAGVCSTRGYEDAMAMMHKNMHAPLAGDADIDFVRQMIPHHQGAVDMAKVQLQYGRDERLKDFNRWIIRAQEEEIGFMKQWLRRHDNGVVAKDAKDYYGDAMMVMHRDMMIDYTGDADVDFVRGMIAHHQGAVDMASILFEHGSDPELNRLADAIYRSQTYEISWMQNWLAEKTGK